MRIIFLLLLLIQVTSTAIAEEQEALIFQMSVSNKQPTTAELFQRKEPIINPNLTDKKGAERFVFWNGISVNQNTDKATDEIKRKLKTMILSENKEFYISSIAEYSNVKLNVLIEKKEGAIVVATLLNDWKSEDDFRVNGSMQSLLSALQKEPTIIKLLDEPIVASFLINNKVEITYMGLYRFTGVCDYVYPTSLSRNKKNLDINFDFAVLADGKPNLIRKQIIEGDDEVGEEFEKWLGGCSFNPKYFSGMQYNNKRIRVFWK